VTDIESQLSVLHPVYALIAGLPEDVRGDAGAIADLVVSQEFKAPASLGPAGGIRCLRRALDAAQPDRKCTQFVLDHFAGWMGAVTDNGRATFLEEFPALAPAAFDLGEAGMKRVIESTNRDPRKFACIACYAMTTKEVIVAMAGLASVHSAEDLQRFAAAVPASAMEDSRDAERLPAAVARVPESLRLAATIAERDIPAAYGTITRVKNRPAGYFAAFQTLAESIGLQASGWCLDKLPELIERRGEEQARAFAGQAAAIARSHGAHAGQAFLEGRIPIAKEQLR
jgi:hypothetical protein